MGSVTHQLGYAEETVYGTVVPVTRPLRVLAGSGVSLKTNILKSEGMIPAKRFPAASTASQVARHGEGVLNFEATMTGLGLLLKTMLGTTSPTVVQQGATPAWLHTYIFGGHEKSLTIQSGIQRADTPTVVEPFTAVGCMFPGWTFSCAVDEYAKFAVDVHARDVLDADNDVETLDTLTYGAVSMFDFSMASFTSDAVAIPQVNAFNLTMATNMLTDRRHLGNSGMVSQPRNVWGDALTGSFEAEFVDPIHWYNDFHSNTTVALVFSVTGPIISGAHTYRLTFTMPTCKILGDGAMINQDVPTVTVPFEVLDPPSAQALTIEYMTTDIAV